MEYVLRVSGHPDGLGSADGEHVFHLRVSRGSGARFAPALVGGAVGVGGVSRICIIHRVNRGGGGVVFVGPKES